MNSNSIVILYQVKKAVVFFTHPNSNIWTRLPDSKQAFLSDYASIRPIPNYQLLCPIVRVSKAVAAVGFTLKQGTWNHDHAKFYQFNRQYLDGIFTAGGVF